MKLEKLTPQQEQLMFEVRDYWLDYIFSCKNTEINKEAAKVGINWLYKLAGKDEPIIIYVNSPIECQIAVAYLKEFLKHNNVWDNVWANVRDNVASNVWDNVWHNVGSNVRSNVASNVWANVRDNVGSNVRSNVVSNVASNVWDNVRDNVWDNVASNVWDSVRNNMASNVGSNVWDNVWDNVWHNVGSNVRSNVASNVWDNVWANVRNNMASNVWDNVASNVRDNVWDSVRNNMASNVFFEEFCSYGSIGDYGWISFYDFFHQVGVHDHQGFLKFKALLQSGIYDMIQLNGFCIVSSLPKSIHRNENGLLHSVNEQAISWDSWGLHYVNGREIDATLFNRVINKQVSFDEFLTLENEDEKAAIITIIKERGGNKGLLEFLQAECVDEQEIVHGQKIEKKLRPVNSEYEHIPSEYWDVLGVELEEYDRITPRHIETVRLYKTKEVFSFLQDRHGNMGQPYAWTQMQCPSTGQTYLIDTSADFTNVIDSMKFHRPDGVPMDLTYNFELFNN